jgi:hypothetical protein
MNSRDRVLCALRREIPDVVPYMYNCMDKDIQERIDEPELVDNVLKKYCEWSYRVSKNSGILKGKVMQGNTRQ